MCAPAAGQDRSRAADSLARRADQAHQQGAHRRAAELYSAAIRRSPGDAWLHLRLAFAYQALGEAELARISAREAADLSGEVVARLPGMVRERVARGRLDEARLAARTLVDLRPGDCGARHTLASLAAQEADPLTASRELRAAAGRCPSHAGILADHGRALLQEGCAEDSIPWLEDALRIDPADARAQAALGVARRRVQGAFAAIDAELGEIARAIGRGILVDAPAAEPSAARAALTRRWRESLRHLARLGREQGNSAELELRLAEFYRLGRELGVDGAEALAEAHVRAALTLHPRMAEAWVLLGTIEISRTEPRAEQAERCFLAALDSDPLRPLAPAWSGLFFAYLTQDRPEAALAAAERYLELVPRDAEFRAVRDEVRGQIALR